MNRNTESHFANTPTVEISRSKFDRSFDHKTTFNTGDLIPIFCDCTIMPGDTVKMEMSQVVRMMTPITPVMDNANLDIYFFFVPYRLVWDHFKRMMGENDTAPWAQTVEYEIPQIKAPYDSETGLNGWSKGSLADYFGYPTKIPGYKASALPFRAYALTWNEWFRDENLQNPQVVSANIDSETKGVDKTGSIYSDSWTTIRLAERGVEPLKVCKYFDYFTGCLPQAQKGSPVYVPLGNTAPVVFGEPHDKSETYIGNFTAATDAYGKPVDVAEWPRQQSTDGMVDIKPMAALVTETTGDEWLGTSKIAGLYTDLSNAIGATVNQLRQAFAIQKFYERQAIGGTRYIEMVKAHFDVTNPDFRMQRPEYLGGKRIPININQVIQSTQTLTDSGDPTTPLGTTGAYSVTADRDEMFTHSFTEHGILLGLACVRTVHTYQQGLNRQYSKKKFTDFYFPEFANLGNQAILNKEIMMVTPESEGEDNDGAFGYQEAWACERYFPDIVTGEMRSNYSQSLDIWHWADSYETVPSLGDKWIQETDENVERTLAVQDHDQFFGDFYFGATYTRPMPLYSIPGLIDHH